MSSLPIGLLVLGGLMTLLVVYLAVAFWRNGENGMAFSSHQLENLPEVMVNRYFTISMVMGGSLYTGRPEIIAFAFAVTGLSPLHDAIIYRRAGKPFVPHLVPAFLSAIIVVWSLVLYSNSGVVS